MPLRTARSQTDAGTEPLATRGPVARAHLPALPGNRSSLASLGPASLLRLQRAAGNAAVAGGVAALAVDPAASVQRCGSTPADECPCHGEDASPEGEQRQATVQRAQMSAEAPIVVQRTTVGPILDEYFSPLSSPRVWVMEESDPYTVLVRGWQPVIDGQAWLLNHLEQNAAEWDTRHRTTPGWSSGMTGHDPAAASNSVPHPPGTDPTTCRNAFIPYVAGEVGRGLAGPVGPLLPRIETWELHTCAIGSFVLRATVDAIDQTAGTATVNIWMQNEMSRTSFGRFADQAVLSGQATQYMWWHWRVQHRWVPTPPPPPPPAPAPPLVLTGDLLFDFNSATVRPEARSALAAVVPALRARPSTNVVGHTDSRGTDEYNQRLSERRAQAVIAVLVAEDGSLAGRLHASGRGESEPVDTNDTRAGRQRNRRVELATP
ncbi:OmpA family protein [Amycolatopsis sp. NPDC058340]|uniref:OmpA family protein n=1 Tax=Amycolatopsis sp. NPDC058340 TaxID=3346453 RepID=UPI00364C7B8B